MRRTSCRGWLSRLAAKHPKSWVGHPEFEPQNRKPDKSAPVTPFEYRAKHAAPICGILRRTRPSSHFTCGGVLAGSDTAGRKVLASDTGACPAPAKPPQSGFVFKTLVWVV